MKETKKDSLLHLERAIEFELQKGCVNVQGHQLFSDFLSQKLKNLKENLKNFFKNPEEKNLWESLYSRSLHYPELPLPERRFYLTDLKNHLDRIQNLPLRPLQHLEPTAPVQFLKGVGPRLAEKLKKLGIRTIEDLLHHYPREYLDRQTLTPIHQLKEDQKATLLGKLLTLEEFKPRPNLRITKGLLSDGTGTLELVWYHNIKNPYIRSYSVISQLEPGDMAFFSGKVKRDPYSMAFQLHNPEFQLLTEELAESAHWGRIIPIYPATKDLKVKNIRTLIQRALETTLSNFPDPLPPSLLAKHGLMDQRTSLQNIHFPKDFDTLKKAKERLIFDEFFYLQLGLAYRRNLYQMKEKGYTLKPKSNLISRVVERLPFQLTLGQEEALQQIQADLASPKPMMRLLQGDVGSGKTIVALLTLLMAVDNGYQGAFMAPTEILAEQHYRKFVEYLQGLDIEVGYLSSALAQKERKNLLEKLRTGKIQLIVGTHALFQKEVIFKELALIIVDEQHRFGVEQRGQLRNKGNNPEILNMTATPIPRTLAMTLHGDLDISTLNALPSGRKPTQTMVFSNKERKRAYELLHNEIEKGRQAYVVYPLIEESEKLPLKAVTEGASYLKNKVFPHYIIGLLHGQMPKDQQDAVMKKFREGQIQILVATTIIEVGVDVPNATVMMIESAERFGLSQLHQLRGRVGRGKEQSYCLLMEGKFSPLGRERLNIMANSTDGFYIAEKDLELRGPGEFLGLKQSGLPEFKIANLITDKELFLKAREDAFYLLEKDPNLKNHPLLVMELKKRFKRFTQFLEG